MQAPQKRQFPRELTYEWLAWLPKICSKRMLTCSSFIFQLIVNTKRAKLWRLEAIDQADGNLDWGGKKYLLPRRHLFNFPLFLESYAIEEVDPDGNKIIRYRALIRLDAEQIPAEGGFDIEDARNNICNYFNGEAGSTLVVGNMTCTYTAQRQYEQEYDIVNLRLSGGLSLAGMCKLLPFALGQLYSAMQDAVRGVMNNDNVPEVVRDPESGNASAEGGPSPEPVVAAQQPPVDQVASPSPPAADPEVPSTSASVSMATGNDRGKQQYGHHISSKPRDSDDED